MLSNYNLQLLTILYDFNSFIKQHPCSKTKKEFFVKFKNKYQIFTFLFRFRIPNFFPLIANLFPFYCGTYDAKKTTRDQDKQTKTTKRVFQELFWDHKIQQFGLVDFLLIFCKEIVKSKYLFWGGNLWVLLHKDSSFQMSLLSLSLDRKILTLN